MLVILLKIESKGSMATLDKDLGRHLLCDRIRAIPSSREGQGSARTPCSPLWTLPYAPVASLPLSGAIP